MFYYMHNNTNYQCKICWNKALTFGVGSIQLSFRIYHCVHPIHANMFSIQMLLHFSQIVPRVCTLVLSLYIPVSKPLKKCHLYTAKSGGIIICTQNTQTVLASFLRTQLEYNCISRLEFLVFTESVRIHKCT